MSRWYLKNQWFRSFCLWEDKLKLNNKLYTEHGINSYKEGDLRTAKFIYFPSFNITSLPACVTTVTKGTFFAVSTVYMLMNSRREIPEIKEWL